MSEALRYEIENVGGIERADLILKPGVSVLRGRNGAGKTSAFRAISRAQGADIELERRDGAQFGEVRGPGVTLRVGKVVRATGHAELSLADVSPLSTLIDPQIKDSDAAARARLRALVELLGLAVDDDAVALLCGGDAAVAKWVADEVRAEAIDDLMVASEKARGRMHALARESEQAIEGAKARREAASGRMASILAEIGGAQALVDTPIEVARAAVSEGGREYERAVAQHDARTQLEERQAALRASIGPRPDDAPHLELAHALQREVVGADLRVDDLERRIRKLQAELGIARELRAAKAAERSAALDAAAEALDQGDEIEPGRRVHAGIEFRFEMDGVWPVLKTVMPAKGGA